MVTILIWVAIILVTVYLLNRFWLNIKVERVEQPRTRDCFIIYYGNKNRTHIIL